MSINPAESTFKTHPAKVTQSRTTNQLKKGHWVILRNGWKAEIWDNMKGNTRVCNVYGIFVEAGSVYAHDMIKWGTTPTNIINPIEHTKAQLDLKKWADEFVEEH